MKRRVKINMAKMVCMGALINCTFGTVPTPLSVNSNQKVFTGTPAATIKDSILGTNIMPFGMCMCLQRPGVFITPYGVIIPQPCAPIISGPWIPGSTVAMVGGTPALLDNCKLMCSYGGTIMAVSPGQFKTNVSK